MKPDQPKGQTAMSRDPFIPIYMVGINNFLKIRLLELKLPSYVKAMELDLWVYRKLRYLLSHFCHTLLAQISTVLCQKGQLPPHINMDHTVKDHAECLQEGRFHHTAHIFFVFPELCLLRWNLAPCKMCRIQETVGFSVLLFLFTIFFRKIFSSSLSFYLKIKGCIT